MRLLSIRLIVSLIVGITVVSLASSYYEALGEKRGLRGDLERRAEILGESLAGNVERDLEKASPQDLQRIVEHFGNREHLLGLAIYGRQNNLLAVTPELASTLAAVPSVMSQALRDNRGTGWFQRVGDASVHIYALPLHQYDQVIGSLAIVHDAGYIRAESLQLWRQTFLRALAHVFLIVLLTLLIVRWSMAGPIARTAQWMRALRTGQVPSRQSAADLDLFRPLVLEVAAFAESLNQARSAAETEARLRDTGESLWTADRLAVHVRARLGGGRLFVVSNREPYMHMRRGNSVEVMVPPSGVVTAIEPILQACDGTWIAHGSGDADLEMVDQHDRLRVPPEEPHYSLRRVWLSNEEEEGYYYGFANEGIWPLCHIAHTRPIFRAEDWKYYQEVNQKFADALLEEMKDVEKPIVLVQDYHFALLPRLIKEKRPEARVAIFWHIPWPNPEAFDISPWRVELVDGLLGADLIGFHIQSHCNNFLHTVDRVVESRVDWEHFSVRRLDHLTMVRPFPISVDFTDVKLPESTLDSYTERSTLLKALGVEATFMGVGVDRVDYTKGILERFLAIEQFLVKQPRYQGQFTFVQIGAPSRSHLKRYQDLMEEVEAEAQRINRRFQTEKWKPIVFLNRQHNHQEIQRYYRAAHFCLVTSLHDGMNLVAKEFVASRDDERGVLILSCFTGAAHELHDALQVNPYDIGQTAEAIRVALEMPPEEKELRMRQMRKTVKEHNVYRWAGTLIAELCECGWTRRTKTKKNPGRILPPTDKDEEQGLSQTRAVSPIEIDHFMNAVAVSPVSTLLLDYDGTLAPFCLNRQQAFPYAGMAQLLQEITANGRTRVVIITGRNAREVIPLLAVHPSPEVWGCHGLERLRPNGIDETPPVEERVLHALAEADRWLRYQGLHERAEFKTAAVAVHWRGQDEATAAETRSRVLLGWFPIAQNTPMELLEFDGGIEMRMPGRDKGDAVRTILKEIGPEVPVAYLGDDLTDERAFLALGTAGLSVLVRPEWRETAAALWIRPPEGLREFLNRWLQACREGQP